MLDTFFPLFLHWKIAKDHHLRRRPFSITLSEMFNFCLVKGLHSKVDTFLAEVD